jgi:hypothetical protein
MQVSFIIFLQTSSNLLESSDISASPAVNKGEHEVPLLIVVDCQADVAAIFWILG